MDNSERGLIDWALATRTLTGQAESGDRQWVKVCASKALVAVLDGVGHGKEAAHAAQTAIATLERYERESPIALFQRCHEQLRSTRGAVMSLASFDAGDSTMTWLGVGNVEGVLLQRQSHFLPWQETLLQRPGVLGDHLPKLAASVIQVSGGDLLIFATDGVREGFADQANLSDPPQRIAEGILTQYGRGTDDALVLVARYRNGKAGITIR